MALAVAAPRRLEYAAMNDEAGGALPDRSKRIYVMWAAGFAFLGLLAIFCVYFLRPCLEVRAAVRRIDALKDDCEGAVKFLGGPEKAPAKCALYVRLPERLAADYEKARAFGILGACGQPAFPWLVSLLGSRDAYVRCLAARELGVLNDSRAVEPLIAALKDSNADIRVIAASALSRLKDRRAVEPLMATLKDSDARVRLVAAGALGDLKDRHAVEPLKVLLADPDDFVRKVAAEAIKKIEAAAP